MKQPEECSNMQDIRAEIDHIDRHEEVSKSASLQVRSNPMPLVLGLK